MTLNTALMGNKISTKQAGRPSRPQIEVLQTRAWFQYASGFLGKDTGYSFELFFTPGKLKCVDGVTERPCKYDKYKIGKHTPDDLTIDLVAKSFPKTKELFCHPFWEVARVPFIGIERLNDLLLTLNPKIKDIIFETRNKTSHPLRRQFTSLKTFELLAKESSLDALTACIGLIHEVKYYEESIYELFYARPTFTIFRRLASALYFSPIAYDLFNYLKKHFFNDVHSNALLKDLARDDIINFLHETSWRLCFIEDNYFLKKYGVPPNSCLHIAENYLTHQVIQKINYLLSTTGYLEVYEMKEYKNLARSLKKWEKKQNGSSHPSNWTVTF